MKRRPAKKTTARRSPRRRPRRPNPARKAVARAALTYDAVGAMGAAEINKRLDALEKESSAITDEFIATGRGYERPSERRHKTDPLSLRDAQNAHDGHVLHAEIARRYGPGAPSRLPTRAARTIRTRNPSTRLPADATARDRDVLAEGGLEDFSEHSVFASMPGAWGGDDVRVLEIIRGKWVVATLTRGGESRRTFATRAAAYRYANRNMWAVENPGRVRRRNPAPKPRTYAVARADILHALRADGWDVRENLKVPHATHPSGDFRLWFKTQAIYFTTGSRRFGQGSLANAYSLHMGDIRTMPVAEALADLERARRMETGR